MGTSTCHKEANGVVALWPSVGGGSGCAWHPSFNAFQSHSFHVFDIAVKVKAHELRPKGKEELLGQVCFTTAPPFQSNSTCTT